MIDTEFIIKYTNALYSVQPECMPRYEEFRDMFSSGQLKSKEWLVTELANHVALDSSQSCLIAGAWFGTLGMLLRKKFINMNVSMLDIDTRCSEFINHLISGDEKSSTVSADMYSYKYSEDIIINTSCEHIPDITEWISLLPSNRIVVLQSNNYFIAPDHVNCVNSQEEFLRQTGLYKIHYIGELEMPMYTRFMIIGETNE